MYNKICPVFLWKNLIPNAFYFFDKNPFPDQDKVNKTGGYRFETYILK